jgi:predicted RNase H-like HicB family nuclease
MMWQFDLASWRCIGFDGAGAEVFGQDGQEEPAFAQGYGAASQDAGWGAGHRQMAQMDKDGGRWEGCPNTSRRIEMSGAAAGKIDVRRRAVSARVISMKLTAIIYPDSETDWLVAECPEIGTASQGRTEEEALANLREATDLYLESFPHALKKQAAIRTFELAHG